MSISLERFSFKSKSLELEVLFFSGRRGLCVFEI